MPHKPKILIVGPVPPPYHGPAVITQNLLSSPLISDKFDLIHLDTSDKRDIMNIGSLEPQNILLAFLHAFKFLKLTLSCRPDIVYVPIAQNLLGYLRDMTFLLPARTLRKKVVIHFHGAAFHEFYRDAPASFRYLIRSSLGRACRIITLGERLRPLFAGFVAQDRIVSVPNGIPDLFPSRPPQALKTQPAVLVLSNLTRAKGLFTVIEAAKHVVDRMPSAQFVMAGAWYADREKEEALRLASELVPHNMKFVGTVAGEAKRKLLRDCDVFVFPPAKPEGLPIVILEAMAAALPVVATRQGAIPEVVLHGTTGFILEPGDTLGVAENTIELLADAGLRRQMGEAGRDRFLRQYTLDRWATDMTNIFLQVQGQS